jgi:hypothetical protein
MASTSRRTAAPHWHGRAAFLPAARTRTRALLGRARRDWTNRLTVRSNDRSGSHPTNSPSKRTAIPRSDCTRHARGPEPAAQFAWLALQRSPGGVEHTPPTHKYCIACDLHGSYRDKLLEVVPEKRVQFIQFKLQSKAKMITFPQTCHQTCRRYKKKTSSQVPRDLQLQRTTKDTRALYSPAPNILIV